MPNFLANKPLYPLIAASAPLNVPSFVSLRDNLIKSSLTNLSAASSVVSFPVFRKAELVKALPRPLAVSLPPCRAARYAAPPAPPAGAVATASTAVAPTSTKRGAIVSAMSCPKPKSSPKSLATSRLSELRRAEFTKVSCAHSAPKAAGIAAARPVKESHKDQATPLVLSANPLKFSSSAKKSERISWFARPLALPSVSAWFHSSA